ncbi:MAG: 3-hydroxyacyl-CoA dehydrogenase family protein [Aquiluna sp.]
MPCLLAEPPAVAQALKLVGAGGVPVSLIQESTGFVSQRVLALMVNQACELAQQGVATPREIDRATRLALGYPQGPLEWGNQLGAERLLRILNSVFVLTGDSRYRSSAWLRRRAQMSLSLLTEEPRRHAWQD